MTALTNWVLVITTLFFCSSSCLVEAQNAPYRNVARPPVLPPSFVPASSSRTMDKETSSTSGAPPFADLARTSTKTDGHPNFPIFSLYHESRTPFMKEARVPVTPLFGSRLQLGIFVTSIDNRNFTEGPFASAGLPRTLGQVRSNDLYGVGVSVPLGRDTGFRGSGSLLQGLSRILQGR
jgi:hypothetical protein